MVPASEHLCKVPAAPAEAGPQAKGAPARVVGRARIVLLVARTAGLEPLDCYRIRSSPACLGIARDGTVGDEVRLSASKHLAALDPSA